VNDDLVESLIILKRDPTIVVRLYEQVFRGRFFALVADPAAPISSIAFLSYPSANGIRCIPLFTSVSRRLLSELKTEAGNPRAVEFDGPLLWSRMLEIIRTGGCEVELDPGESHGIRLTKEMILGMVSTYGDPGAPANPA
jgi:SseB protein N-terminal domain